MTVSKRARFEVLRRDNYTCRYCRSTENPLTIDHVVPVTLGGRDDPSNLVTACRDCNAGKSSATPNQDLVAEVKDDAIRHAESIRRAYAVLVERLSEKDKYLDQFIDAWADERIDANWRSSVARFWRIGVPVELLIDAAEIATSRRLSPGADRFAYMCGIVWKQVETVTEAVVTRDALDGAWMTVDDLTNERIDAFKMGIEKAEQRGDAWTRMLSSVVDRQRAA